MAFDTKAKRSAALGFGLAFTLVLPPADGTISIEDAGHASTAYRYDMPAAEIIEGDLITTAPAYFCRSATVADGTFARASTTTPANFRRSVTAADTER